MVGKVLRIKYVCFSYVFIYIYINYQKFGRNQNITIRENLMPCLLNNSTLFTWHINLTYIYVERDNKNYKNKCNCSGPPAFNKSQRVEYQPNQILLYHYQHSEDHLNA